MAADAVVGGVALGACILFWGTGEFPGYAKLRAGLVHSTTHVTLFILIASVLTGFMCLIAGTDVPSAEIAALMPYGVAAGVIWTIRIAVFFSLAPYAGVAVPTALIAGAASIGGFFLGFLLGEGVSNVLMGVIGVTALLCGVFLASTSAIDEEVDYHHDRIAKSASVASSNSSGGNRRTSTLSISARSLGYGGGIITMPAAASPALIAANNGNGLNLQLPTVLSASSASTTTLSGERDGSLQTSASALLAAIRRSSAVPVGSAREPGHRGNSITATALVPIEIRDSEVGLAPSVGSATLLTQSASLRSLASLHDAGVISQFSRQASRANVPTQHGVEQFAIGKRWLRKRPIQVLVFGALGLDTALAQSLIRFVPFPVASLPLVIWYAFAWYLGASVVMLAYFRATLARQSGPLLLPILQQVRLIAPASTMAAVWSVAGQIFYFVAATSALELAIVAPVAQMSLMVGLATGVLVFGERVRVLRAITAGIVILAGGYLLVASL